MFRITKDYFDFFLYQFLNQEPSDRNHRILYHEGVYFVHKDAIGTLATDDHIPHFIIQFCLIADDNRAPAHIKNRGDFPTPSSRGLKRTDQ